MQGTWENGRFVLASTKDERIADLTKQRDELQAELAALKQQDPVAIVEGAVMFHDKEHATFMVKIENCWDNPITKGAKLYLAPQPSGKEE